MDKRYLGLGVLVALFGFGIYGVFSTGGDDKESMTRDSIIYKTEYDTVYVDKKAEKPTKPIPSITKFKATDWVCAWGKWSGVVREINWSTRVPNTLVYTVQHYDEEDGWYENDYVDTELEAGKCN